ncbi:hypothetical protein BN2364_3622 [Alloalcanivorax xenomutans]|nr:hypothetical protein BN2364_3622 [Alloalcanivorax xenomutans]
MIQDIVLPLSLLVMKMGPGRAAHGYRPFQGKAGRSAAQNMDR